MDKLAGRIAAVTGAATGLGRAIAQLYAREGAALALLDRDGAGAEAVAAGIRETGGQAVAVAVDVSDETAVREAFGAVTDRLGAPEILVNNAGIVSVARLEDMPTETWDTMMAVDLRSVFLCCRAVLPAMRAAGYGRIVNISSQIAHKGGEGMTHYAAAKAGVIGLTRSLAHEVTRDNIAVNVICPGPLDTSMELPAEWARRKKAELIIGRSGRVEEIAPTALLLACEDAAFYVGATFNPNGGDVMI